MIRSLEFRLPEHSLARKRKLSVSAGLRGATASDYLLALHICMVIFPAGLLGLARVLWPMSHNGDIRVALVSSMLRGALLLRPCATEQR